MAVDRSACMSPTACKANSPGLCRDCAKASGVYAKANRRGGTWTAERRAEASARLKIMWQDRRPELTAAADRVRNTPEFKANARAKMARAWAENLERMLAITRAAGRAAYEKRMAWCPPDLRDDYRVLSRNLGATAARQSIQETINRRGS